MPLNSSLDPFDSGDRIRVYRLAKPDQDFTNAQACLTRKYEKYLTTDLEPLKWTETPTKQGLEPVTDTTQNIYKPSNICDSTKAKVEILGTDTLDDGVKSLETPTTKGLDAVTDSTQSIYKLGHMCDNTKAKDEASNTSDGAEILGMGSDDRKARLRAATEYVKVQIREAITLGFSLEAKLTHTRLEASLSQFGDDAT